MTTGIESFYNPPRVEFNPTNREHLLALALLQLHGRQHPTLRFRLDPTQYRNVYVALIDMFIKHALPKDVIDEAASYAELRDNFVVGSVLDSDTCSIVRLKVANNETIS